jgi:phosphoglycerate dehydrogenase-like enzyme
MRTGGPVIVVEDDKILRFLHALLDPACPPARLAALADFLSVDLADFDGWLAGVRGFIEALYPADVRMVATEMDLAAHLPEADIIVLQDLPIGIAHLGRAPRLKGIVKFGTDTRNIDRTACDLVKVAVRTVRRAVNCAVAEHAMALMLAVGHKIVETHGALDLAALRGLGYKPALYDADHIAGANWARVSGLKGLYGATLGALGLGEVGREVASRAKAMGMRVLYHQRTRASREVEAESDAEYVSFDDLLRRADFLSIHLPLTDATRGLIGAAAFGRMKDGAVLINVSRAPIVDRAALMDALASGRLGGAGLDVHFEEPGAADEPLKSFRNVVLSPHIAVGNRAYAIFDMEATVAAMAEIVARPR